MIPAEAVEAARTVLRRDDLWELSDEEEARLILEAAAPHMLSHEADELAAEYRRGYRDGLADRKQVTASPREWEPGDPIE